MQWKVGSGLIAALAACVAGCGSSAPQLTRAQFIARADVVCRQAIQAAAQRGVDRRSTKPEDLAARLAISVHHIADGFKELNPPSEVADQFDELTRLEQEKAELLDRFAEAARSGAKADMVSVRGEIGPRQGRVLRLTSALGLQSCS